MLHHKTARLRKSDLAPPGKPSHSAVNSGLKLVQPYANLSVLLVFHEFLQFPNQDQLPKWPSEAD